MADDTLSLSGAFEPQDEAAWLTAVEKALKGKGPDSLARKTHDGITIQALYREADFPSARDPLGAPGTAPFLRGPKAARDPYLPWDIRQAFAHPDPAITRAEILRDLERGVSSVELQIDPTGRAGVAVHDAASLAEALRGVRGDIATVALDHGDRPGLRAAALLAAWGETQVAPAEQKLAFNIDPLGALARAGHVEGGLDLAFARCAALFDALELKFPRGHLLRIDARCVHEAGGSEAQELGALIAHGVDTLRRLDAAGIAPERVAEHLLFTLAVGGNYGLEIAKLRAARRLWARCLVLLDLPVQPMRLQAVSSARMLTRYDPWVNMLRGTAACFAGAVGGADIISIRPFTDALGVAEELGRRVARNTQIIAMEESQLGRVADPAGGAWFEERLSQDLAEAAWAEFQRIEAEGGYGASLVAGALQSRVREVHRERMKQVATRKASITGVSRFPLLDGEPAPVAQIHFAGGGDDIAADALEKRLPQASEPGEDTVATPLEPIRLAEPFERLRERADAVTAEKGARPAVFLATLGALAEHTARADFARNLFAAGGIEARTAPTPPATIAELTAALSASGCAIAVLCGSDTRYTEEAEAAAKALKAAGVTRLYLAGRPGAQEAPLRAAGVDSFLHIGVDIVAALELAQAELGMDE